MPSDVGLEAARVKAAVTVDWQAWRNDERGCYVVAVSWRGSDNATTLELDPLALASFVGGRAPRPSREGMKAYVAETVSSPEPPAENPMTAVLEWERQAVAKLGGMISVHLRVPPEAVPEKIVRWLLGVPVRG